MNFLEFLSATIGQLVWPVLIGVFIWLMRKPIRSLVSSPGLRRLKAGPGGIELEIDRSLDDATRELTEGQPALPREPTPEEQAEAADFTGEMRQLAQVMPRAVVMESHARLEHLLRQLVDVPLGAGSRGSRFMNLRSLGRLAVQQGLLTKSEAAVLDDLAVVRNAVAHSPEEVITYDRAVQYAELVKQLAVSLRLASGQLDPNGGSL